MFAKGGGGLLLFCSSWRVSIGEACAFVVCYPSQWVSGVLLIEGGGRGGAHCRYSTACPSLVSLVDLWRATVVCWGEGGSPCCRSSTIRRSLAYSNSAVLLVEGGGGWRALSIFYDSLLFRLVDRWRRTAIEEGVYSIALATCHAWP